MSSPGVSNLFSVNDGLSVMGPELVEIIQLLESAFINFTSENEPEAMLFPPLMPVEDLARIDYFQNFPHLGILTSQLDEAVMAEKYLKAEFVTEIPGADLQPARYALLSAACYPIYFHLGDSVLSAPRYITTTAQCFRSEQSYDGLKRLRSFRLQEIVCLGPAETVRAHLEASRRRILQLAAKAELPLEVKPAADPFYDSGASRARMQKLISVKDEFVYQDDVAVGSVNFHRNFFGERCNIRTADGQFAFSGCVGIGLERWLYALLDHHDGDLETIRHLLAPA